MSCKSCQRDNAANRRFCGGCGASLAAPCPTCSFQNDAADRFCGGCGLGSLANHGAAPPPMSALPGELTDLFALPARPTSSELPEKVSQESLDQLFGQT